MKRISAIPITAVNDFVIKFANVNGSGSASANELFAKAVMRMGVPVSPRNIFPSNIQGMPTWYEARVCEQGYHGRRGGVDMMVAMNPQTWDSDVAEIEPGGYLLYDCTRPLPPEKFRADVLTLGIPFTELANAAYTDPRQRQLFKNIIYVGALSVLLDVEVEVFDKLLAEQYQGRGKERLLESNRQALQLGRDYVSQHLQAPLPIRVRRSDNVGDQIFTDGNSATALGLLYGGATVAAWYPITPSSSIPEVFQKYCSKYRVDPDTGRCNYAIVQAEDELASIGMVVGAGWNGARAFTATSGPGISLMTEFIGLAYFAEIPVTIINVQRGGPSTGMPTRTQQSDLLCCAYASHGDTKHVLLFPQDPHECFEHAATALDLGRPFADARVRHVRPGHRHEPAPVQTLRLGRCSKYDTGKVMTPKNWKRARTSVATRTWTTTASRGAPCPARIPARVRIFTRGTAKDATATPNAGRTTSTTWNDCCANSKPPQPWCRNRCSAKPRATRLGVIYYGSTTPGDARGAGCAGSGTATTSTRCVCSAYPFPRFSVRDFIAEHDRVFVVEQNRDAQMRTMLINELEIDPAKLMRVLHYDGTPITARFIISTIRASLPVLREIA